MRKILLILFGAFIPLIANAQRFELSVKGGLLGNNIKEAGWGKCAGLTGLVALGSVRIGLGISSYSYSYREISHFGYTGGDVSVKVGPYIPIEALVFNRFGIGSLSLDFGVTGGVCARTLIKRQGTMYTHSGLEYVSVTGTAGTWGIGGFIIALQYNLTKKLSVGIEVQAKKQFGFEERTIYPVMIRLGLQL